MQYIKTKNLTQKKQVLCGLRGIFLLFSCQTPAARSPGQRLWQTKRMGGGKIFGDGQAQVGESGCLCLRKFQWQYGRRFQLGGSDPRLDGLGITNVEASYRFSFLWISCKHFTENSCRLSRNFRCDIIPSLTVNRRKNRRIPCIYWAAAIFSLLRTIVIYSFPLLFFWIVLILPLVMNW